MTSDLLFSTDGTDIDTAFNYRVVERLVQLGKFSMISSALVAIAVCSAFWNQASRTLLGAWLGAVLICLLARFLLLARFWHMSVESRSLRGWTRAYLFFLYLSAACWGALPILDIFQTTEWARSIVIFVAAGMSSGGLVSLYPLLRAAVPYILIVMVPCMAVLAREPDPVLLILAAMTAMYCIMLIKSTFVLNKSSNQAIRKDIENRELFKFLKKTRGAEMARFDEEQEWVL